jgi:ADP-ribose pyrophosphatase
LVEQYRIGPYSRGDEPWVLELVAGMIDKAESPDQVGIREAEEEAGCLVRELEPIAQYYSSPGGSSEYFYLFCGLVDMAGVGGIHGLDEEAEDIKVHVISTEQIFAELDQGHFRNAHTLIALQWLKLNRRRFEL